MSTLLAVCWAPDKQPTGRFPLLDVGPRPVALGRYFGWNTAPLMPLRGRARGYTPSAHITSPLGARHVGPMAPAHGRAGRPGLATVKPLARPLCVGGGALPPADLARVGAGTPLDRAYGHRLPRPVSSRVGRELRPGLRGAGRLPHCCAVAPHARSRACQPVRLRSAYKTWCYRCCGGEGSIPRGHNTKHQAGDTGAAPGGTTGGASGGGEFPP